MLESLGVLLDAGWRIVERRRRLVPTTRLDAISGEGVGGDEVPFGTRLYVTNMTPKYLGMYPNSGGASCSTAS